MVVLTSFSPPTEGIKHEQPSTTLVLNGREIGTGTLYIAESQFSWRDGQSGQGFTLLYPHIGIHAVSRDIEKFGRPCLYVIVDQALDDLEMNGREGDEDSGGEEEGMTELRFAPADEGQLDAMFQAMTFCQAQHPDPQDQLTDSDLEDEEYEDADYNGGGDSGYIDDQNHADNTNGACEEEMETDGQFEDAEDER